MAIKVNNKASSSLDISTIFSVAKEMIPGNGEDSYYYQSEKDRFIIASLDGCGGSGSKKYEMLSGKTGAYIASRAVAGALESWFKAAGKPEEIESYIGQAMEICRRMSEIPNEKRMMGSLGKAFPTTAAIITGKAGKTVEANVLWAGDSRCYLLSDKGLCQLTADDLDGQDAMSNLLNDGVMTNVISAGAPFELHKKSLTIKQKCILLCCTDGCFGYLNSPMEFEYLLLATLVSSKSISEWKSKLDAEFADVAGDDYTLTTAAFGYYDFEQLRNDFMPRIKYLKGKYIDPDVEPQKLWEEYKKDYSVYLS